MFGRRTLAPTISIFKFKRSFLKEVSRGMSLDFRELWTAMAALPFDDRI